MCRTIVSCKGFLDGSERKINLNPGTLSLPLVANCTFFGEFDWAGIFLDEGILNRLETPDLWNPE